MVRPLPPTLVCPVKMTETETADFWTHEMTVEAKRMERCVACEECEHQNYETHKDLFDHWGAGCARECSLRLCVENTIFDWTDGACKTCADLRDGRLCSAADQKRLGIEKTGMTGNLPSLQFVECRGRVEGFDGVQYGRCELCVPAGCDESEYEASCYDPRCQACDQSRTPAVRVLQQRWSDGSDGRHVRRAFVLPDERLCGSGPNWRS